MISEPYLTWLLPTSTPSPNRTSESRKLPAARKQSLLNSLFHPYTLFGNSHISICACSLRQQWITSNRIFLQISFSQSFTDPICEYYEILLVELWGFKPRDRKHVLTHIDHSVTRPLLKCDKLHNNPTLRTFIINATAKKVSLNTN